MKPKSENTKKPTEKESPPLRVAKSTPRASASASLFDAARKAGKPFSGTITAPVETESQFIDPLDRRVEAAVRQMRKKSGRS